MTATFAPGEPLDSEALNKIWAELEKLKTSDAGLSAKITSEVSLNSSTITNVIAKKMVASSVKKTLKLTGGTSGKALDIQISYPNPLTGKCAAFIYSLQMDTGEKVDLSSALIKFNSDSATVSVQKVTSGTDTYTITVHYLAIAAN